MGVDAEITGRSGDKADVTPSGHLCTASSVGCVGVGEAGSDAFGHIVYKFLTWESGPVGGDTEDLITISGVAAPAPSVFIYQVPEGKIFYMSRINFLITDANIRPDLFGGIAALSVGCLAKIVNARNEVLINFCDGRPIQSNGHFAYLAGADIQQVAGTSTDTLPIRWSLFKAFAGRALKLTAGQKFQWTNQDALTGLDEFRAMVQGWLVDA